MKKTYMTPALEAVKIETTGMMASSPQLMDKDAVSAGMGRDFDFEDEE